MISIIVAFPKLENAKSIKSILVRGGYSVNAVCTSGSQVLQYANELRDGVVVCQGQLRDMVYQDLYQELPPHFQMLLVDSQNTCSHKAADDIVCLTMPLKVYELLKTLETMEESIERKRKKRKAAPRPRTAEEQEILTRAKARLMEQKGMTEEEAHHYIQKNSMDSGRGLVETARIVLRLM